MKLHFVDTMDQVLQIALESPLPKLDEEVAQPIAPLTTGTSDAPTAHQ
jgi:ATP-dependent Lon protease